MLDLVLHIEYLLGRHDCVTVPGFGAFINVRTSASFDEETMTFTPMSYEVRFNQSVNFDDGLLVSSFARKFKIPFEQGRELMMKEIESLRGTLLTDGEVTIGQVGIIRQDNEGVVSFHPFSTPKGIMGEMGYHEVSINNLMITESTETLESPNQTSETFRKVDNGQDELSKEVQNNEKYYYFRINKTFVKVAATLLVLVSVALSVLLPGVSTQETVDKASVMPLIDTTVSDLAGKTLTNGDNSETDTPFVSETEIQVESKVVETPSAEIQPSVERQSRYYLIVATFKTEKEAESFINSNRGNGYELESVKSRRLCRVSAKSSEDKGDLLSFRRQGNFSKIYPEAWIWHE